MFHLRIYFLFTIFFCSTYLLLKYSKHYKNKGTFATIIMKINFNEIVQFC